MDYLEKSNINFKYKRHTSNQILALILSVATSSVEHKFRNNRQANTWNKKPDENCKPKRMSKLPAIKQVTGTLGRACRNEPNQYKVAITVKCEPILSYTKSVTAFMQKVALFIDHLAIYVLVYAPVYRLPCLPDYLFQVP
ncbi:hypothetical protein LXL04_033672 [Taraxacum kok-saghyz]